MGEVDYGKFVVMHPIMSALGRQGRAQAWLAQEAGISPQYLNDIVHARTGCGGQTALRISRALDGAVTVEQILDWWSKAQRRAQRRAGAA
jgi:DNA-binding transcriptional regulator YdaS (Cro superfamily)